MSDFFDNFDNEDTDSTFGNDSSNDDLFGDFDDGTNGSPINSGADMNGGSQGGDSINTKKVLIISVVVGIVGVCLAFFLWSHLRGGNVDTPDNTVTQENVQTQQNVENKPSGNSDEQVKTESTEKPKESISNNSNTMKNETKPAESNFVEVDSSTMPYVSEPVTGCFTVIDIKTFAKKKDGKYGNYFKSIIYGNLTGLDGIYELTVPFESVSKVHIGDVLDVKYTTVTVGDDKYVVDIR